MKAGWKTTEFWSVVAFVVGSVAAALAGHLHDSSVAYSSAVAVGAYAIGRGLAKSPSWSSVVAALSRMVGSGAPAPPAPAQAPAAAELLATRDRLTAELEAVQAQLAARGTAKAEV